VNIFLPNGHPHSPHISVNTTEGFLDGQVWQMVYRFPANIVCSGVGFAALLQLKNISDALFIKI
jgi:hypothetical protein